jgi:hypothetical protein
MLQRQLARVRRRLFLQTLVSSLLWCWTGALVLLALWFLVQALLLEPAPARLRLITAGAALAAATALGIFIAVVRAPRRLAAALLLDDRFELKERVTTAILLPPGLDATPAAQALVADTNRRLADIRVGRRFPIRVAWQTGVAPLVAGALAVAAFNYAPAVSQAKSSEDRSNQPPANAPEIEQKVAALKKKPAEKRPLERAPSEELKRIEAELEQIANRPRTTKEQLKERIKEMTTLEDRLQNRERELAERTRSMREQLKQLDRMSGQTGSQEGPAKDLQKALSEGKLDKARQEIERLAKKLKDGSMSDKEKKQLERQLEDLQKKLERLAQQKDKVDELNRLHKEGKLNAEALKREMEQIKQDAKKLENLEKLAKSLQQVRQNLEDGKSVDAGQGMQGAADQMKDTELDEQEQQDLKEQLQRLQDAKDSMGQAMGDPNAPPGDGPGGEGIGAGRRPRGTEHATKSFETKAKGQFDKGKIIFDGYAPGSNFRKKTSAEMVGEIQQASQEAPEAIEQQRIPKAARDMAKGYFRNLGGHGTDTKPANPR